MSDVKMFYIDDDISKIQTKTNLYIKQYGPAGASHLCREVIQNSIDELMDKDSGGNTIHIIYDKKTDTLTCEDDGRGFPEQDYPMDIFCTKIQSGSKFFRDQSGVTSGEFGLGLTAVNALSTTFSIESHREKENYMHKIQFNDGKKISDEKRPLKKGEKKHGCIIKFSPSAKYLGKNTMIPIDEVQAWVELMSYLIPKDHGIKIKFEIWDGLKQESSIKIKSRPFDELLLKLTDNDNYSPKLHFNCYTDWVEDARVLQLDKSGKPKNKEKKVQRYLNMEIALRYIPEDITKYDTFCNFTNTIQGGIHQAAFEEIFCRMIVAAAKDQMTETQWEKYRPTWDDVRSGLCCVINLNTNAEVGFVGNVKEKIDNQKLLPILKECIQYALGNYFDENKGMMDAFVKIVRMNAKARIDLQKVKEASKSTRINSMAEHMMRNLIRCNNTGKNQYREIFIVEGTSASGSLSSGCDRDTQAFFQLRGVPKNAFKVPFSELMQNKEWSDLKDVLRAGIGKEFDVSKCWYKRINIMTDSDIDGYYISLGILSFLYKYMYPAIEAGMVYKVMAPLYRIDDKKNPYVLRKSEITEIFFKNISKVVRIQTLKNAGLTKNSTPIDELKKESMYEFLEDTRDYLSTLNMIADISGKLDARFVECVLALVTLVGGLTAESSEEEIKRVTSDQKFIKAFMSKLQSFYPETQLHGDNISGIVYGRYYTLKINRTLLRHGEKLLPIYDLYGYRIGVIEKDREPKIMSILEFLNSSRKYQPVIEERFKGLGELNAEELQKTVLRLDNRISIQYTTEDVERELEIFNKLMGSKAKDVRKRIEMMKRYHIDREDLDN